MYRNEELRGPPRNESAALTEGLATQIYPILYLSLSAYLFPYSFLFLSFCFFLAIWTFLFSYFLPPYPSLSKPFSYLLPSLENGFFFLILSPAFFSCLIFFSTLSCKIAEENFLLFHGNLSCQPLGPNMLIPWDLLRLKSLEPFFVRNPSSQS